MTRELDDQEKQILKALIKDPRMSDNKIGRLTGVPIRTVSRKRKRLEDEEQLSYYVSYNNPDIARHLYIIKFKMGITKQRLIDEIIHEGRVKTLFTEMIEESVYAEIDGQMAIVMIVAAKNEAQICENFNGKILPLMLSYHGEDSITGISTIRLSNRIRLFHNYLPFINVKNGKLEKKWPLSSIYI